MSATNPRPMYYSKPTIDPNDDRHVWLPDTYIIHSQDGGATWEEEPTSPTYDVGLKTDHHVLRVDPANSSHIYVVGDGGLMESFDMGKTYIRVNNIPVGQIYRVAVDNRDPYWIYIGLQDNHSFMGPSATRHWLGILNQDWVEIGFSDGTGKAVDKDDWRKVYSSSTNGNLSLVDPMTGDAMGINPRPPAGEPRVPLRLGRAGDGVAPYGRDGVSRRQPAVHLQGLRLLVDADAGSDASDRPQRSGHDGREESRYQAVTQRWRQHQRDHEPRGIADRSEYPLGRHRRRKRAAHAGRRRDVDGAEQGDRRRPGRHVRRQDRRVRSHRGAAYVSFDAHRDGDFKPYIFKTTDFGKTWTSVVSGLPNDDASVRSLAEYPGKPNVLFAGTERALFYTLDAGVHWAKLTANLPTTRYDDIAIHPRTHDLILATHGRGVWILDDASPIAEWTPEIAATRAHLFNVPRATLMLYWEDVSNMNHYFFAAENPAEGATFTYNLARPAQAVTLAVANAAGRVVREVSGPVTAGQIHRVNWDLRFAVPPGMSERGGGEGGEEGGGGRFGPGNEKPGEIALPVPSHDIGPRGPHVAPGTFKVTLQVDGTAVESKAFEVRADPQSTISLADHQAREAFEMDVMDLQRKVETMRADLQKRREAASGDEAARLQALEQRLVGGGAGRPRPSGGAQPVRQRLNGLITAFVGSGARTGTLAAPTTTMKATLAEAKADLAAIEKESAPR